MIVKIKSHKRPIFKQLLEYMINSKDRLFDKQGRSFCISHNLKGNSIKEWSDQFKLNELKRLRKRKDSVRITHEILSWHKDDTKHITIEKLHDIAREYIRQRNPNGLYVAVPHFDRDHYHIHICASGVESKTGKSLRLSKANLSKLKKGIQQYQIDKYPELQKSIVKHGVHKQSKKDKEYKFNWREGRETDKERVIGILKTCFKKANSSEDFYEMIEKSNIKTYRRNANIVGVIHNNRKYRFSRLGFTEHILPTLNKSVQRENDLRRLREKKKVVNRQIEIRN